MYFALLTWCTGTTIGKRLMNLRVVPADGNEKLSFVDVLYRETVGRFLCGISIWIGYIIVGIDKEKRGFHDMLCDTRVVYEKKSENVSRVSECGRTADVCTAARTSADTELCTEKCASAESVTARTTV
ncbi:MAG: RDD family protein [Dorea formicigenerans]